MRKCSSVSVYGQYFVNPAKRRVNMAKTIDEVAQEVIRGKYGNGDERKKKLEAEGYNYSQVQAKVNELMKK